MRSKLPCGLTLPRGWNDLRSSNDLFGGAHRCLDVVSYSKCDKQARGTG